VCLLVLIPAGNTGHVPLRAIGAAVTWAATNLLFLLFWTPIVHGKFVYPRSERPGWFRCRPRVPDRGERRS